MSKAIEPISSKNNFPSRPFTERILLTINKIINEMMMKTKITSLVIILIFSASVAMAQKTNRKTEKEARRIEQEKQIEELINSKSFQFVAQRVLPQGYSSVNLSTTNNWVKFSPEHFEGSLPYFGRAFSAGYGDSNTGIEFDGTPDSYTIEKGKKGYKVNAKIKSRTDAYTLTLAISPMGSATLMVLSNNRSLISYNGNVSSIVK